MQPDPAQYREWAVTLDEHLREIKRLLDLAELHGDVPDLTAGSAVENLRRKVRYWHDCADEAERELRHA